MKRAIRRILIILSSAMAGTAVHGAADDTVTTVVYARVGNGYQRERAPDGRFQAEYYALSNGGRIVGTSSDSSIDRVTYPEVAEIAAGLLQSQNYHYAQSKEQAKLLIVLNWGTTHGYNNSNYTYAVQQLGQAVAQSKLKGMYEPTGSGENVPVDFTEMAMENRVRDTRNLPNAKILGYLDAINQADGIQRWAGGGDRYNDLLADIEEPRYYIVISAYDFPALDKTGKKKLLWQTRVSVRSPGNSFDQSFAPMLKSASRFFGQDSLRLVRSDETKGTVEMGELKFLGEAREALPEPAKGHRK